MTRPFCLYFSSASTLVLVPLQVSPRALFFHFNIDFRSRVVYSISLSCYPVYSAGYLLSVWNTIAMAIECIPFGWDKQVQTMARELARAAHHQYLPVKTSNPEESFWPLSEPSAAQHVHFSTGRRSRRYQPDSDLEPQDS